MAFVDQNFWKWDANSSGWLDALEFAAAFAQVMYTPSLNPSIRPGPGVFFTQPLYHAL
jgi:hypothetical protein